MRDAPIDSASGLGAFAELGIRGFRRFRAFSVAGHRHAFPAAERFRAGRPTAPQPAVAAANGQTTAAALSKPATLQTSPNTGEVAKLKAPEPARSTTPATSDATTPDHTNVQAQATGTPVQSAAPVQSRAPATQTTDLRNGAANAKELPGDAINGRQVFKKCRACDSLEPGKTILGPSLAGIVNRKSAAEPGFNYSPALKRAALTWDAATLDAYLMDPAKVIPGNRMPFPGLKTGHDRKDVIAFLAAPVSPAGGSAAAPSAPAAAPRARSGGDAAYLSDAKYTLRSGIAEGKMVFLGVGGSIDGKANPVLTAAEGQIVELTLINGEGTEHDIVFPDQDAKSPRVNGKGASTTIVFRAAKSSGDRRDLRLQSRVVHRLAFHGIRPSAARISSQTSMPSPIRSGRS